MTIPIQRLQRADRLLGGPAFLFVQPLRWLRRRPRGVPRRVLLVKFWGLGSLQLMTPAIDVLRRRYPGASLELLTLAPNSNFATGLRMFDRVLTLDIRTGWVRLGVRILRLFAELRKQRFDAVYDFEFFTRFSAVVSLVTGAPASFGFVADGVDRSGCHTHLVRFDRGWHVARNFRALAGGEDGTPIGTGHFRPYTVTPRDRAEALAALWSRDPVEGPLVVLNPNAGELSLERRWPTENFVALAERLIRRDRAWIVLLGSQAERTRTRAIRSAVRPEARARVFDLAGELSIGAVAALLDETRVFVTNDSGPMHMAGALGVPTVALFGPETPRLYRPPGDRVRVLYRPPSCSPCINVHDNKLAVCTRGRAECMTNLNVDTVLWAVREELSGSAPRPPESSHP